MIDLTELLDAFWEWLLTTWKAALFSAACALHLGSMVLFEASWRIFRTTKQARDFVDAWKPVKPAIFEVPRAKARVG